jgi:hypothetical protein
MRKIGNMANGSVTRGLLGLRSGAFLTGVIPISLAAVASPPWRAANRKSGIRIRAKSPEISTIQISNRKYFAASGLRFLRFPRFLIYGSAIKNPRKALKT